ncbi:MAG: DUF1810 domain-containing protein [Chloroflexota bacterium]
MSGMHDPFDLQRFVDAQTANGIYEQALAEVRLGRKVSHWMWFVFPQVAGLGSSAMSQRYAIGSLDEARAYLHHPVLGPRLIESSKAAADAHAASAEQIFGRVDARKLQSSMTLFVRANAAERVFQRFLDRYFNGCADPATDAALIPNHPYEREED